MTRAIAILLAIALQITVVGCGTSKPNNSQTNRSTKNKTPHFKRLKEAEEVFKQLGKMAWCFEHRGEVTCDFKIYRTPSGKDAKETLIHHFSGDRAWDWVKVAADDREQQFEKKPQSKSKKESRFAKGYLIVVIDNDVPTGHHCKVVCRFSVGVGSRHSTFNIDVTPQKKQTPGTNWRAVTQGGSVSDSTDLKPGETISLATWKIKVGDKAENSVSIRYVLTASALKDGKFPDRKPAGKVEPASPSK